MSTTRLETEIETTDSELSWLSSESDTITSTTKPGTGDLKENDSALNKFSLEIDELEKAIADFPYNELRSVKVTTTSGEVFAHASSHGVQRLLDTFSSTFFYSGKKGGASYLKQSQTWSKAPEEKKAVIRLATALLNFRTQIQKVEESYFATRTPSSETNSTKLAKLRDNSTWVTHFHYVMEQYLDSIPVPVPVSESEPTAGLFSKQDYANSIKNIKKLYETTYSWIAQNLPEELGKYSAFKPLEINNTTDLTSVPATTQVSELLPKGKLLDFFGNSDKKPAPSKRKKPAADKKADTVTLFNKNTSRLSRKKHNQEAIATKTPDASPKISADIDKDKALPEIGFSQKKVSRQRLAF